MFYQLLVTQNLNIFPLSQINYHENKRMVCVFNLKYLSQNLVKLHMWGVFWKRKDQQIPKLSLVLKIDQDLQE